MLERWRYERWPMVCEWCSASIAYLDVQWRAEELLCTTCQARKRRSGKKARDRYATQFQRDHPLEAKAIRDHERAMALGEDISAVVIETHDRIIWTRHVD